MQLGYHLSGGGAEVLKNYKLGVSIANVGVVGVMVASTGNIGPSTTTDATDAIGISTGTGTYSTTQATLAAAGSDAQCQFSIRPDLVCDALMTGGATEGTALVTMTNTSASSGGTVLTATIQSSDIDGGTLWCIGGANVGQSRTITTHTSTTSLTVTVPFLRGINVGDTFLASPWNNTGTASAGNDGITTVQLSTLLIQANATSASGTGIKTTVVEQILKGANDSHVLFLLGDHVYNTNTV